MDAEQVAKERWGKLPKTFKHNRRDINGKPLPDDFPTLLSWTPHSRVAFQQKVNEYDRINGYENGKYPWEDN
jgi:hypothetical protein